MRKIQQMSCSRESTSTQDRSNQKANYIKKVPTKFLTGGRQTTRSTSLEGRDKLVAFEPKMFVLDLGHKTWRERVTRLTAQLI